MKEAIAALTVHPNIEDRLLDAAIALANANDRLSALRVRGHCVMDEGSCWAGPALWACDPEDACDVCKARAENAPMRRVAKADRAAAMRKLLRAARRIRG